MKKSILKTDNGFTIKQNVCVIHVYVQYRTQDLHVVFDYIQWRWTSTAFNNISLPIDYL